MGQAKVAALAALRERIRVLEDRGQVQKCRVESGVDLVDQLVLGLPQPGILELCGPWGSGCTRLALQLAAAAIARGVGRMSAWVDWQRTLFPPAVALCNVELNSLLIIHPPANLGTWAAEQLMRSGCFSVVVVSDPHIKGRAGQRWSLATEQGQCTAVIVRHQGGTNARIPADIRLSLSNGDVFVLRNRGGHTGASSHVALPTPASPWG